MTTTGSHEYLASDYIWHTVKLSNLTPSTGYFYRTVSGSEVSEIHRFKTQVVEGTDTGHYRFAIIGDHQNINDDRYESLVQACKDKVIEKYASSSSDTLVSDHLSLMVFDGDQVTERTLAQYEGLQFGQSRPLMSNIPFMTMVGNHEYNRDPALVNYFGHYVYHDISYKGITGIHGEEYYAFQVANIVFVMINSVRENDPDPDQYTWIEDIFTAADADPSVEWVIASNHYCFYNEQMPSDGHAPVRDGYGPRLAETDKYTMHITGHAHLYARGSIRNHPCHVIINGGASEDQYWGQVSYIDYQDVQKTIERQIFQIVYIDLDNREMVVETLSNGTNLSPGFREDLLIDTYYMKLDAPGPDKPSIANSIPENLDLPFTFEGSTYSGQEPFNSVEFQVADDTMNFEYAELSFKTDYELAENTDESLGSGLNGTPNAGVTFINDPELGDVADFNNNGMITISSGSTASLELPTEAISVSCWVMTNSTDDWGGFVGIFQDNGDYEKGWVLGTRYDHFSFAVSAGGSMYYLEDNNSINLGEWYHVVGTYDGITQKIYVNGELQASVEMRGEIDYPPTGWFQIGAYKDDNEDFGHDGAIADVLIWDGALTQADVLNIYNNTMPPSAEFDADIINVAVGGGSVY